MRKFWFGSSSPEVNALAAAFFTMLLTTANAPAQSRSDSGRDDSTSSSARDRDNNRASSSDQSDHDDNRASSRNSQSSRQPGHASLGVVVYNDDSNPLEIRRVLPGSPAEEADLERGDEIVSINGHRVSSVDQLRRQIDRVGADEQVEIGILRDGRQKTVSATLTSRRSYASGAPGRNQQSASRRPSGAYNEAYGPSSRDPNYEQGFWDGYAQAQQEYGQPHFGSQGYNQSGSRSYSRGSRRFNWQNDDGQDSDRYSEGFRGSRTSNRAFLGVTLDENARDRVRVSGIYPNSPAEEAGIRPGDEIVAIDDDDVHSNRDLQRLLSQKDVDDDVRISVDRNGRERTLRATLVSQQDVVADYNRGLDRMGRRNSYPQNYGNQGNYRDGSNDNRRQRQQAQDQWEVDDSDNY